VVKNPQENMNKIILSIIIYIASTNILAIDFNKLYKGWSNNQQVSYSASMGKELWSKEILPGKSCKSCHGSDLTQPGKHIRTNKIIKPLSLKSNPERLTKEKKINKWLKRNCKFTYKRECSPEEKISFIEFIRFN